jgi:hypothetical protein
MWQKIKSITISLLVVMCFTLHAQSSLDKQIGFSKIVSDDIAFKALENYLDKAGTTDFLQELEKKVGYLKISESTSGRYFGIACLQEVRSWQFTHATPPNTPDVLLVEAKLRTLIYDVEMQSEVLRETFVACVVQKADNKPTQVFELCKEALLKNARMLGQALIAKLPVRGKVTAVSGTVITVNLGKNHSVNESSVFEVLNKKGELVDEFTVLPGKVFAEEARVVSSRDIEVGDMEWRSFTVRCRNKTKDSIENDRQKLLQATLPGVKVGSASEKEVPLNPPVRFAITDPRDQHEIYLGSQQDPGSTTLKAICWDTWGDEIKVDPNKITWSVTGSADMLSGSQLVHKRVGSFELQAKYEKLLAPKNVVHITRVKRVVLEPKKVTLLPGQSCDFLLTGINNKDQEVNAANIGYQIDWQMSTPDVVNIANNKLVACGKPGKCTITAQLRNEPSVKAQTQVVILPPLDVQIVDLQDKPLHKVKLAPGEDLELQYKINTPGVDVMDVPLAWQVTPKEAGKVMVTGTDLLFTAGTAAMKRVVIEVVLQDAPAGSARRDDFKLLYVEIEPKRADQVVISTLSPEPFVSGETIQLQVQGLSNNKVIKDLEFKIACMPSANSEMKTEALRGYYTLTPSQPGRVTVVAMENFSGQEGKLPLTITPETSQVSRVELSTQNGKREVRPGESLLFLGKAFSGQKEIKECRLVWSLTPRAKKTNIDDTGLLTAGGEDEVGEYTIMVSEEKSRKSDSVKIQVMLEPAADIKMQVPDKLEIGVKYPLAAIVLDKSGNRLYNRKIVWTTASGGSVADNVLTADKPGVIRLLASVEKVQVSQVIEVTKPQVTIQPGKKQLAVTRMLLSSNGNKTELAPGENIQFRVQAFDGNTVVDAAELKLKWSVSEAEHKIERDGLFTAGNKIGATLVTVKESISNQSQSFKLRVRWQPVTKIVLSVGNSALQPEQATILVCRLYDEKGQEIGRNKSKVLWKTTGGSVDEAKMSYVSPNKPGFYRLWVTDTTERIISNVIAIVVKAKEVQPVQSFDKLVLFPQNKDLEVGQSCDFDVKGFNSKTQKWETDVTVKWRIEPANSDHAINSSGQLELGTQTGTFQIVSELAGEESKQSSAPLKGMATVVVKRTPQKIVLTPRVVKLSPGMSRQFTAKVYDAVEGAMEALVTWSATGKNTFDSKTATFTAGNVAGVYEVAATLGNLIEKAQVEIVAASALSNFVSKTTLGFSYKVHKDWQMQMSEDGKICFYFVDKTMQTRLELAVYPRTQFAALEPLLEHMESRMLDQMPGVQNLFDTNKYEQKNVQDYTLGKFPGKLVTYLISYKVDSFDDAGEESVGARMPSPQNPRVVQPVPPTSRPEVHHPQQPQNVQAKPQNVERKTMRNWRQMPRVIRRQKKYINIYKFIFMKGNNWYTVGGIAPLQEWEIHWPNFEICLNSLDVVTPVKPAAELVSKTEVVYNATYRVAKNWNEDTQTTDNEEKSIAYNADEGWIQFEFLDNPGQLDEAQIRILENRLFADWHGVCARMSFENVALHGLSGSKVMYVLNKAEDRSKYYAVMFCAIRNDTLYLVHYMYAAADEELGKLFETSLNSLAVKEAKAIAVRNPVAKIEIVAPKQIEVGKKATLSVNVLGKNGNKLERRVVWNAVGHGRVNSDGLLSAAARPGVIRVSAEAQGVREAVIVEVVKVITKPTVSNPVETKPPVEKPPVSQSLAGWNTVRDKQFGISYQSPTQWQKQVREDGDDDANRVVYRHPQFKTVVLVFNFLEGEFETAQTLAHDHESRLRANVRTWKRTMNKDHTTANNLRGVLCQYTYTDKKQINWVVQAFYLVQGDKAYICLGKSPTAHGAELQPVFDKAVNALVMEAEIKKKSSGDKKPKKDKKNQNRSEEDD